MSKNPQWEQWATQVNVNYHDGNMSLKVAEEIAGVEPPKWIIGDNLVTEDELVKLELQKASKMAENILKGATPEFLAARTAVY